MINNIKKPLLSVIICTYNRSTLLEQVLNFVTNQTIPLTSYEVLIINNNSTDNTVEIIKKFQLKYQNIRLFNEYRQGLSYARNLGYQKAHADWILYLDDDVRFDNDLIEKTINIAKTGKFVCFGGIYTPFYLNNKPRWFRDEYVSNIKNINLIKDNQLSDGGFITGCLMAIKKDVLIRLNGFPVNLGMSGEKISFGEETYLQIKMRKNNYPLGFFSELKVQHVVHPYKLKVSWFVKSAYLHSFYSWVIFEEYPHFLDLLKTIFYNTIQNFRVLITSTNKLLFKKNYYYQNWLIDNISYTAQTIGRIFGGFKILLKNEILHY